MVTHNEAPAPIYDGAMPAEPSQSTGVDAKPCPIAQQTASALDESPPFDDQRHPNLTSTSKPLISTAHGFFLQPSPVPGHPPVARILRGVNLSSSSKYPTFPDTEGIIPQTGRSREERDDNRRKAMGFRTDLPAQGSQEGPVKGIWDEAEAGGREGWFVNRPMHEEWADTHFQRLKAWGYTMIRWIVPWEALEHAGPGKYDEAYISYTIRMLRKAQKYDFKVFVSPHQDVFARYIGGSGAPYWSLLAMGINPRRVHQTGSSVVHSQWSTEGYGGVEGREAVEKGEIGDFPDMIWNTNTGRLAARHCFTMFYASDVFAPKCTIDGKSARDWLQGHFNAAYAYLAKRLADEGDLLDSCVIGWDSVNEPDAGLVEIPDLNDFPPSQEFRKGPSPTPIQSFLLASGQPVSDVQNADFGSLGLKNKGKMSLTPPNGEGMWLTRKEAREAEERWGWKWGSEWDFWGAEGQDGEGQGCPWAGHGVWDPSTGKVLVSDYFAKRDEKEFDFIEDFWRAHYTDLLQAIRQHHPQAISFINPPIFQEPPHISQEVSQSRVAISAHFYDALTMLGKRRHLFNADAVGIQRGKVSMLRGVKLGWKNIRQNLREQLGELASDATKEDGVAGETDRETYPMIVGELGTPWDMKNENRLLGLAKGKLHEQDYEEPAKAMDQLLNSCDGSNALSYTLWAYEPLNTRECGDGWNGEDLSLFSFCDAKGEDDLRALNPPDLHTLITLGSRGIHSWCRPYPLSFHGTIEQFDFHVKSGEFTLIIHVPALRDYPMWVNEGEEATRNALERPACAELYLPYVHYAPTHAVPNEAEGVGRKRLIGEPETGRTVLGMGRGMGQGQGRGQSGDDADDGGSGNIDELDGKPLPAGAEWKYGSGSGAARIDLEIIEMSEGAIEVEGQWGKWYYDLKEKEARTIKLKLKPWRGQ